MKKNQEAFENTRQKWIIFNFVFSKCIYEEKNNLNQSGPSVKTITWLEIKGDIFESANKYLSCLVLLITNI